MRIIMTPVGSSGDVNPFVTIGRALRARGHTVILIASEPFAPVVTGAGLEFVSNWSADDFDRITRHPDLWHPVRGLRLILRAAAGQLRQNYALIEKAHRPGHTILVGHMLSFPTRVFEETHRVPAVTVQLAPSAFRSDFGQPGAPPARDFSRWPRWAKRTLWWGLDRFMIDPPIVPALNAWRAELRLAPVARLFKSWVHSPRRVVGLFPDWFGEPQPDWPAQTRLAGFVLSHGGGHEVLDGEIRRFVEAGSPPLVFTPGSANRQADRFFNAAAEATLRLGRRALFLTRFPEQLPAVLPEQIRHAPYAPLTTLLPSCAALVHHGGIGTCAQGFGAGIPQLVMPMAFDQPDNALRVARLGCGGVVPPRHFSGPTVASAMEPLLTAPKIIEECRRRRRAVHETDAVGAACAEIEGAASEPAPARIR